MNNQEKESDRIPDKDRDILRRLADEKAAAAAHPVNTERRDAWYAFDRKQPVSGQRPMVLAEIGGIRDENHPVPESLLECRDAWARDIEQDLRIELYQFNHLKDDHVIEPWVNLNRHVSYSDYGVQAIVHSGDRDGKMGARSWEPPIKDLDSDFEKLHPRSFSVDREATALEKDKLESVFEGLLPVRIRGAFYWTMGLTWSAIDLIGLESLMISMYDNAEGLHRIMGFLRDDHLNLIDWLEKEGLYSLNNENDYIGSGSIGYTHDLPKEDTETVHPQDLWVLSESQETVGVGPEQFEEFVFPYQLDIAKRFGKCYYGCCEPVNNRWHILKRIPNLERVSVSPWADQEFLGDEFGRDYVFSRKPNPTLISTADFDEEAIRQDLRTTLAAAEGCRLEIIMKDVHTLANQPERIARWVELAGEEIENR